MQQPFVTISFFTFRLKKKKKREQHQVLLAGGKRNWANHVYFLASQAQVVPTLNLSELSRSLQVIVQRRKLLWAPEAFLSLHLYASSYSLFSWKTWQHTAHQLLGSHMENSEQQDSLHWELHIGLWCKSILFSHNYRSVPCKGLFN